MLGDTRLALADKLAQRSIAPLVESVAAGQRLPAPAVVELDPTSFCDLACPECVSGPLLQQGRFDADRLLTLGTELIDASVRAVILIGGGEPLMHPAIGELITQLGSAGISIGLTTNGTQISRYLGPISKYVAWTRVSVDAAKSDTYAALRPHRGRKRVFEDVIAGMRVLAAVKRGDLGFSFLLVSRRQPSGEVALSNLSEVKQAAELARAIGCDYFEVKPEYDLQHFLQAQPPEHLQRLRADLDTIRALEDEDFSVVFPEDLHAVLDRRALHQPKSYGRCPISELRTLVTSSGAFICPYHRGNERACYGDPTTTNFRTLWQSELRDQALKTIDPRRDCEFHCIRDRSNRLILDHDPPATPVEDYDPFI
jgi:MoaA/NifB/PqqE/SkfB family radical SAM enzyme